MGLLRSLIRLFSTAPHSDHSPRTEPPRIHTVPSFAPQPRPSPWVAATPPPPKAAALVGPAHVVDGDTIIIGGQSIRLAGIDAPELDQPYGQKARWAMVALCKGQNIRAELLDGETTYERLVARCFLPDGRDLAAELVKQGLALDWGKHSGGAYRALETPDARKKLWRSAAKHRGKLIPK